MVNTEESNFYKPKKTRRFNRKVITFLFFLMISFIFWLLNSLNGNFNTNINYPVQYTNLPSNKVLGPDVPTKITLNLTGHGYTLMQLLINARKYPVVFNVNANYVNKIQGDNAYRYYILTSIAKEKIRRQLSPDIEFSYIIPDTLFFSLSDVISKKVVINPRVEYDLDKQIILKDKIFTTPDSVVITGQQAILDTISSIKTKSITLKKINQSIKQETSLEVIPNLTYNIDKVILSIPVEEFTETSIFIPIRVNNLPDSIRFLTFPSQLTVTYSVGLSKYEHVSPKLFKAFVDFNETKESINSKLKVTLEKYPDFIKSVNFKPKDVDFLIKR